MEIISFEGVDLAELLPRIPDSIKNDLPFGLVKLDTNGIVLEYNMAEGEIAGVDPNWALGKSFFEEVAVCTKTAAFYGRFVEGVKKGFLNVAFDYVFDHRSGNARVKVQMVMLPDHLGRKTVMVLVRRANQVNVVDAVDHAQTMSAPLERSQTALATAQSHSAAAAPGAAAPSIQDIVSAVMAAMNAANPAAASAPVALAASAPAMAPAPAPFAPVAAAKPPAKPGGGHTDIFQL